MIEGTVEHLIERRKAAQDRRQSNLGPRARDPRAGNAPRSAQPRRAVDAGKRPGNRNIQERVDAGYLVLELTPAEQSVVRVALCQRRQKCAGWELSDLDRVLDALDV